MIKPPTQIFIAYGHNHKLKDKVESTLSEIAKSNHFRLSVVVVKDTIIRTGTGAIGSAVHEALRSVDAAIVLLTADDYTISREKFDSIKVASKTIMLNADELINRMELRARQNVIYEIGYLTAKIGRERYYIIVDPDVVLPSNLGDIYQSKNFEDDIQPLLREFVERKLKLKPEETPLYDTQRKADYSNFTVDLTNIEGLEILDEFEKELEKFDLDDDRILYLYERIVFDSYFQRPKWWRQRIDRIQTVTPVQSFLVEGLRLIEDYMAKWRPPERRDYPGVADIADKLLKLLANIKAFKLAPIVHIVLGDYAALALDKSARNMANTDKTTAVEYWTNARDILDRVIELCEEFEDKSLSLWRGYALYNKARILGILEDYNNFNESNWMAVFQDALNIREGWTQSTVILPKMIAEGLLTEYLHSKATRIAMRKPHEKGKFAITDNFIKEARIEFEEWYSGPTQDRVRLAKNVIETWEKNIEKGINIA